MKKLQIGVIGYGGMEEYPKGNRPSLKIYRLAKEVGFLLAQKNIIVVTGGKGGVMESVAKGAKKVGGLTVGVVKGEKRFTSNKSTDLEVITGMKSDGLDELFLVLMCDALIVVGGGAGTLQEIAIAYRNKKPIIVLEQSGGWSKNLAGKYLDERKSIQIQIAKTPKEAVKLAINSAGKIYAKK